MGVFNKLREDRLIRPINPDKPVYDGWRDDPNLSDWKRNPAVQSENTERTKRAAPPKPQKPTTCMIEGCNEPIYKLSRCKDHWKIEDRERRRQYRVKRREYEKALQRERAAANGRSCEVCGDPVPSRYKRPLCKPHNKEALTKQASELRRQKEAELAAKKEKRDRARNADFEKKWERIKARYEAQNEPN